MANKVQLDAEANAKGKITKRGKLKMWIGPVPDIPLSKAVALSRAVTPGVVPDEFVRLPRTSSRRG
jgi:hypothetical protein